jgi:acetyl esterase/lipase
MAARSRKANWLMSTVVIAALIALALFSVWRWAVATGSAGTLEWIDARFARDQPIHLALAGNYGPAANQNVELWVPDRAPPPGGFPLVAFVYGGGWHSGATRDYRFVARTLGDRGYAVALVGYRLVPQGHFPNMLEDTAVGVRWARDHAAKAGARGDRLALIGHSAGAYNVVMLALDPQWLAKAGVPESAIQGVVGMAGPYDFYPFDSDSARNALGGVTPPQVTQPVHFARAGAPPLLLMQGDADDVVKPRNAARLQAAMEAAHGASERIAFPGMGHAGIVMGLSKPFAQHGKVLDPILAFLRRTAASVPVQGKSG